MDTDAQAGIPYPSHIMKNVLCVAVVLLTTACTPVLQPRGQPERYPERVSPVSSTCGVDAYKEPHAHRCLDKHLLLKFKMKRKFNGRVQRHGASGSGSAALTGVGEAGSSEVGIM